MKRAKRNPKKRAFRRGYISGLKGKDSQSCPFTQDKKRLDWIEGWHAGRSAENVVGLRVSDID